MARGSTAMILVAFGVLAMMTLANCSADERDDELFARQARGILLRTWRTVQQLEKQHRRHQFDVDSAENYDDEPSGYVRMAHYKPFSGRGEPADPSLHEKRTPPSNNFLGMRGKKNVLDDYVHADDYDDAERGESDESIDVHVLDMLLPKNKKMDSHTFFGMRGKKRTSPNRAPQLAHYYAQKREAGQKRMPGSYVFLGARGKRRPTDKQNDYI